VAQINNLCYGIFANGLIVSKDSKKETYLNLQIFSLFLNDLQGEILSLHKSPIKFLNKRSRAKYGRLIFNGGIRLTMNYLPAGCLPTKQARQIND